jgi:rubrerythrin
MEENSMGVFFSSVELVRIAVRNEETGFDFYTQAAARARTPELKRLFDDLAAQEQAHKEKFLGFMRRNQDPAPPDAPEGAPSVPTDTDRYIAAMTDNRLFDGENKNIVLAATAADEKAAVEFALGFEKDTLLFFYQMLEQVRSADQPMVQIIILEEKNHIRRLAEIRKELDTHSIRS